MIPQWQYKFVIYFIVQTKTFKAERVLCQEVDICLVSSRQSEGVVTDLLSHVHILSLSP